MTLKEKILHWKLTGEPGVSSETIAFHLAGLPRPRFGENHPLDPSDFNRCLLLLEAIPELKPRLGELKAKSREWAALIDRWDEVEASFFEEVGPNWCNGNRATNTYKLMQQLYADAQTAHSAPAPSEM